MNRQRIEEWVQQSEIPAFNLKALRQSALALFPQMEGRASMVIHIMYRYRSIMGLPGITLLQREPSDSLTPEQVVEVLMGVGLWVTGEQSYTEYFKQLRSAQLGIPVSELNGCQPSMDNLSVEREYLNRQLWKLFVLLKVIPDGSRAEIEAYAPVVYRFLGTEDASGALTELDELLARYMPELDTD